MLGIGEKRGGNKRNQSHRPGGRPPPELNCGAAPFPGMEANCFHAHTRWQRGLAGSDP